MEASVKLNLGCGYRHKEGFINVDLETNWCEKKPDVSADVRSLPFPDAYADEVHAYHVFEHFYRYEADAVLDEWVRVLKPNGLMVLELPCLDKILALFDHFHQTQTPLRMDLTLWGLYGDPKYKNPAMVHRWCYSLGELTNMLEARGLSVTETKPQTHQPIRDMRLECIKAS